MHSCCVRPLVSPSACSQYKWRTRFSEYAVIITEYIQLLGPSMKAASVSPLNFHNHLKPSLEIKGQLPPSPYAMSDPADSNSHPGCVKVAIVGSGLAGLTAAYLLSTVHQRADVWHNCEPVEYEVHVFEKVCAQCAYPLPTLSRQPRPLHFSGCDFCVFFGRRDTFLAYRFPFPY
jgi:hypothetical protein